ncbi:MAG: hypothetical protein F2813_05700 [Actinobacteria bacterium]|uniref:Unannotated protein n=1 Tax=freshwater metagenome TaxID=449393 RepID=A0A6J5ZWC7_9ZZZZ|nr:hypothetical protein [Actinomycetota bacterium]
MSKITPDGGSTILGTTGIRPSAITIDSVGNIYTANSGSNNVTKLTPGGTSTILGITGSYPEAITIDSVGNIYTANSGANNVTKLTPAGVSTTLGSTGNNPRAITVDLAGNIYTTNNGDGNVTKISPAGVTTTDWATTGFAQFGITLDPAGNVYTGSGATSSVWKITRAGVTTNNWAATGSNPTALTLDSAGNVYTANLFADNVSKITSSSYPAAPAKPAAPSAVLGNTGSRTATVSVAANPLSAANGAPSSYTVTAVQDASKRCTISFVQSSCVVSGLTNGTAYTFTAKAKLATWQTAASAPSGSVKPVAPVVPPAKPAVAWSSSAKAKTVTALISPVAGVTYTLTATNGSILKTGVCKNVTIKQGKLKVARRSCTLKLAKGTWNASVIPAKGSTKGTPNSKRFRFK